MRFPPVALSRRQVLTSVAASAAWFGFGLGKLRAESSELEVVRPWAPAGAGHEIMYASIGPQMVGFAVDLRSATLRRLEATLLPANIQYAWPHPRKAVLYIASSNQAGTFAGDQHHLSAFAVDPQTGALRAHGAPVRLRFRPVNITVDPRGENLLTAYPNPSGLTVHRLNPDGTIGSEVPPAVPLDCGVYAHQVRVTPAGDRVILVTRGNDPGAGRAEDPGALKLFDYRAGVLGRETSIAPAGGLGFGPRHLDFHPTQPWAFVSQERENILSVYDLQAPTPAARPLYTTTTLAAPTVVGSLQAASAVHVDRSGRFVYVMNRATGTVEVGGKKVFAGGENSLAVFALDPASGRPRLIQSIDTQGWSARTFSIDPTGRILIVANQSEFVRQQRGTTETVPASLAIFRVAPNGTLQPAGREAIEVGGAALFWNGFVRPA